PISNKQVIDNYMLNQINYISDTNHDTKIFLLPLLGLYINSCFYNIVCLYKERLKLISKKQYMLENLDKSYL
ncbi:hypothetical protein, partial [Acinetobacter baumannii]|uniref:hypothetical protein n=1 Tax=Acinetobacter baumannii TaxID=470 RepID=UPI001CB80A87